MVQYELTRTVLSLNNEDKSALHCFEAFNRGPRVPDLNGAAAVRTVALFAEGPLLARLQILNIFAAAFYRRAIMEISDTLSVMLA